MPAYQATTGVLDLATLAAAKCIFSISNPTSSGLRLLIKRLSFRGAFSGTAANSKNSFGLTRATGTAAAGTQITTIAKRRASLAAASAIVWKMNNTGPADITGLTPDSASDFKTCLLSHQVGTGMWDEMIEDIKEIEETDPLEVAPGTSLAIFTRAASVAGASVIFDIEWSEVPL
jgi:hypothetical protein